MDIGQLHPLQASIEPIHFTPAEPYQHHRIPFALSLGGRAILQRRHLIHMLTAPERCRRLLDSLNVGPVLARRAGGNLGEDLLPAGGDIQHRPILGHYVGHRSILTSAPFSGSIICFGHMTVPHQHFIVHFSQQVD